MAAIVNDNDIQLQSVASRLVATTVVIFSNGGIGFTKTKNGGPTTPISGITLTADTTVFSNPTFQWAYARGADPDNFSNIAGQTAKNVLISPTLYTQHVGTDSSYVWYKVTVNQSQFSTATSQLSIGYTKEADDPLTIELSRSNVTVPSTEGGVVTPNTTNTDTTIRVRLGSTYLPYTTTSTTTSTFSVSSITVTPSNGLVLRQPQITTSTYTIPGISTMSDSVDSVAVKYAITIRNASNVAITPDYEETQTYTKVKTGANSVTVNYTNDSVPVPVNNAGTPTWAGTGGTLEVYDGGTALLLRNTSVTTSPPSSGTTGYTVNIYNLRGDTLTLPDIQGLNTSTVTITDWAGTLTQNTVYRLTTNIRRADNSTLALSRDVSILPVKAGESATAYWIVTDASSVVKTETGLYVPNSIRYTIKSVTGSAAPADYNGRFIIKTSVDGNTYLPTHTSTSNTSTYLFNSFTADLRNIRADAYIAGGTTYLLDTEDTSIIGDGINAVTLNYTNDSVPVPINVNTGVTTWTGSGGNVEVYDGGTALKLLSTNSTNSYPASTGYHLYISKISGDTLTIPFIQGLNGTTATLTDWSGTLTQPTIYRISAYVRRLNGTSTILVSRDISIVPGNSGKDGTAYWISASSAAIAKTETGLYIPNSLTYTIKNATGTGSPQDYFGRFIISTSDNGSTYTPVHTSASDTSTYVYSSLPANIRNIRARAYLSGGITTLIDTEDTSIIGDGINAVTIGYTNDSVPVPVANDGTHNWSGSGGTLEIYDGGTLLKLINTTQTNSAPTSTGYNIDITKQSGDTLTEPTFAGTTTVTVGDWSGVVTQPTVYRITAYVRRPNTNTITVYKDVSIVKQPAGENATAYWLSSSVGGIGRTITGLYVPSSVTYTIRSSTGTQAPTEYSGRLVIATSENGTSFTNRYTSSSDQSAYTYTLSNAETIRNVRAEAYLSGGTTTKIDTLGINVASDGPAGTQGADGLDSVVVYYTNESVPVPISKTGTITWAGTGGNLEVYDGSTRLVLRSVTQISSAPTSGNTGYNVDIVYKSGDNGLSEPILTGHSSTTPSVGNWGGTITQPSVYTLTAHIRRVNGNTTSISRDISLVPNRDGLDGTAYWLTSDATTISRSITGLYAPTSVKFTINTAAGTTVPSTYSGRFVVATSTDGSSYTNRHTSSSDTSTYTYSSFPAGTKFIRAKAYLSGGTTTELDTILASIVDDGPRGDAGTQGTDAAIMYYTNDAVPVPIDKNGNINWTGSGGNLEVFEGNTKLTLRSVTQTASPPNSGIVGYNVNIVYKSGDNGLSEPIISGHNSTTPSLGNWGGSLTQISVYTLTAHIRRANDDTISVSKDITIVPNREGLDGTAYWIVSSNAAVGRSSTGLYTPTSVTFDLKRAQGTSTPSDYNGRFIIATADSAGTFTNRHTSSSDTSTYTYTSFPANIKSIRARAYLAGGTTTLLDTAGINIASDGEPGAAGTAGVNPTTAVYTNQSTPIPVNLANVPTWSGSGGTLEVFEGSSKLNLNTNTYVNSAPASTGFNIFLTKQSGDTLNFPVVSGQSTTTATLGDWSGNSLTQLTVYRLTVHVKRLDGNTLSMYTDISIAPIKPGTSGSNGSDGRAYWLVSTSAGIGRTSTGLYIPNSITYTIKTAAGTSTPTDYSGRFVIATADSAGTYTNRYTSSSDESSYTYTSFPANIKAIRAKAYLAGGTTTELDTLGSSVSDDGQPGSTGTAGTNAVTVYYTNDSVPIPISKTNVPNFVGSGGTLEVYDGGTVLSIKNTTQTTSAPSTNGYNFAFSKVRGDTLSTLPAYSSGTTTVIFGDWNNSTLTQPTVYRLTIYVKRANGDTLNVARDIVLAPNPAGIDGDDGTAYWLTSDATTISRSITALYAPTSVKFTINKAEGTTVPSTYSGRFVVATSTDGSSYTNRYTSSSDESTYTYTSFPAGIKFIRAKAYLSGGTTTELDTILASIVDDGPRGAAGTQGNTVTGSTGASTFRAYAKTTSNSTTWTANSNYASTTTNGAAPTKGTQTWQLTPVTVSSDNDTQWQIDGTQAPGSDLTYWSTPYLSYFKVGALSAITANVGTLDVNTGGYIRSGKTNSTDATNAGFFIGNESGIPKITIGNSTLRKGLLWDGTDLTIRVDGNAGIKFVNMSSGTASALGELSAQTIFSWTGLALATNTSLINRVAIRTRNSKGDGTATFETSPVGLNDSGLSLSPPDTYTGSTGSAYIRGLYVDTFYIATDGRLSGGSTGYGLASDIKIITGQNSSTSVYGNLYITSNYINIDNTGELKLSGLSGDGQIRLKANNTTNQYTGLILRNDGTDFYILRTSSGSPNASWNTARPFYINFATDRVSIEKLKIVSMDGMTVSTGTHTGAYLYNKPGTGESSSQWLTLLINGTTYYVPVWT